MTEEAPKRAAIYVRVSQNRDGDEAKPQRQIDRCTALAEVRGYEVVEHVYVDDDVSAYQGKKQRPEFRRLLDDLDEGGIDVVLTWNTDRMLRTVAEMVEFIEMSRRRSERGDGWVSIDACAAGGLDLSTPGGRMVATILASVAQHEVELKSERHKVRNDLAIKEGKSLGGPVPFGWRTPQETTVLKAAIKAYLNNESLSSIARSWNEQGLTTVFNKPWNQDSVRKVLTRPRNAGLVEHRGKIVDGAKTSTVAVCTREQWEKVQQRAEAAKVGHRPPEHLLSGLMTCSNGHKLMSGLRSARKTPGGKQYAYAVYRCNQAGCRVNITRDAANEHVRMLVRDRLVFGRVEDLLPRSTSTKRAGELREEIGRLRREFDANQEDFNDGLFGRDHFRKAQAKVMESLERAEERLARIEAENAFAAMLSDEVKKLSINDAAQIGIKFDALPLQHRRLIVSTLFPTIEVMKVGRGNRVSISDRITAKTPAGDVYRVGTDDMTSELLDPAALLSAGGQ